MRGEPSGPATLPLRAPHAGHTRPVGRTGDSDGVGPNLVLLYDGRCALCDGSVRAVLACDRRARFRFAALESAAARALLAAVGEGASAPLQPATVVLIARGRAWTRSSAVVHVLLALGLPWSALGALLWLVPKPLRDVLYAWVAAKRVAWFGRLDACRVPAPTERERFLDAGERG